MPGPYNVPDAPGVPPINRAADQPTTVVVKKSTVNALKIGRWGIFDKAGKTEILATGASSEAAAIDSCVSIGFDGEVDIPDYPLEGGSFETYNKVDRPFIVVARLAKSGAADQIAAFEKTLIQLKGGLDPLTVLTPEYAHVNVNVVKVSFRRSAEAGANMIVADVTLKQMRLAAPPEFSNTATPAGATPVDSGNVQARPPTTAEQKAIADYKSNPDYPGVE
jgi:hypothetical protein